MTKVFIVKRDKKGFTSVLFENATYKVALTPPHPMFSTWDHDEACKIARQKGVPIRDPETGKIVTDKEKAYRIMLKRLEASK